MSTMTPLRKMIIPLISAILLVPLCAQAAYTPAEDIPQRKKQNPEAIYVVTANLRQALKEDYKTDNGWNQRKELCRDVLFAQPADIYCLQENRDVITSYLLPYRLDLRMSNSVLRNNQPINPILYSATRFEKIKEGGFWLSPTPDVDGSGFPDGTIRLANWVLLKDKLKGNQLYVINTHLDHKTNGMRLKQLGVILDFVKTLPPDVPRILTGDFNTGLNTGAIQSLLASGWIDSYSSLHGTVDPGGTAHRFLGEKFLSSEEGKTRKKIDFILTNRFLKSSSSDVIKDSRNGKYPSDHYFISAELEYTTSK